MGRNTLIKQKTPTQKCKFGLSVAMGISVSSHNTHYVIGTMTHGYCIIQVHGEVYSELLFKTVIAPSSDKTASINWEKLSNETNVAVAIVCEVGTPYQCQDQTE